VSGRGIAHALPGRGMTHAGHLPAGGVTAAGLFRFSELTNRTDACDN